MEIPEISPAERQDALGYARMINLFALALYRDLCKQGGNLFFSPYSISMVMAMVFAGADGETESQIADVMQFSADRPLLNSAAAALAAELNTRPVEWLAANQIWPHKGYPLRLEFLRLIQETYGVSIAPVDFSQPEAAREQINSWISERTGARIPALIPRGYLTDLTRLVLTNAVYFRGQWQRAFDAQKTVEKQFYRTPVDRVLVPMMSDNRSIDYYEDETVKMVDLPYSGGDLVMTVMLPTEMAAFERDWEPKDLLNKLYRLNETSVNLVLPRFSARSWFDLNQPLIDMGMPLAFDAELADFSGMDPAKMLFLRAVLHQGFIEVDEEGTRATAATAAILALRSAKPPLKTAEFIADRPFLFLVRDRPTGAILFMGRLSDPSA